MVLLCEFEEHVWGMDSIMEGYLLGDSEDEAAVVEM